MYEKRTKEIFTINLQKNPHNFQPIIGTKDLRNLDHLTQAWERYGIDGKEKEIGIGKDRVKLLDKDEVNCWYCLFGVFLFIICTSMSSFFILIPQHNVIKMPKFWYESLFVHVFG